MTTRTQPAPSPAKLHARIGLRVLAVLFLVPVFGIAAVSSSPSAIAAVDVPFVLPPAPAIGDLAQMRKRCGSCGRVQSIERIEATQTDPLSFEMTVRLHDGSLHKSSSATAGKWRVGDGIILIGEAR
jgi:hypothetical protein